MTDHRCVLIGCGHRGQTHARAIADSERMSLAAVVDRNEEQAAEVAARYDVPATYSRISDALSSEKPTHVSAVTPPSGRVSVVREILGHEPVSLLIEKPVANTLDEVERIASLVETAGTTVTVCHQKPYADEFVAVKRWLDEGRIGDVERLVGSTKGGLTGQGTHFLHAIDRFAESEPTAVRGFAEGPVSLDPAENPWVTDHAEPEDTVVELSYPDDVRGYLHLGPGAPDIEEQAGTFWYEFRIDVIGTDGRAELVLGDHAKGVFEDGTEIEQAREFEADAYMTRRLYEDLGAVLSGERDTHPADFDSALAVHRVVDAAMRSALDGRAVHPLERPPDVGRSTNERLRRRLYRRRPVCVSSSLFGDRSRTEAFQAVSDLGIGCVDLWSAPNVASHADPATDDVEDVRADLDEHRLSAPIVTVGGPNVEERIRFAGDVGAESIVFDGRAGETATPDVETMRSWLAVAEENDLTASIVPGFEAPTSIDDLVTLLEDIDHDAARVALAPPALLRAGESPEAVLSRLGDRVDALYLWDTDPGQAENAAGQWWDRPESQVPGGGAAVDFDRLVDAAIDYAPGAEWVLRYHGVDDWSTDRIRGSLVRALRAVENARC